MRKARWVLLPVVTVLLLSPVGVFYLVLRPQYQKPIERHLQQVSSHSDALAQLQKAWAGSEFFQRSSGKNDAGPFLNPRVEWSTGGGQAQLRLDPKLSEEIRSWGSQWLEKGATAAAGDRDFSWLTSLRAYDHWELSSGSSPLNVDMFQWATAPLPDFPQLVDWAKLHLVNASSENRCEAAADVRHLAALCWSTETLIGSVVGAKLNALAAHAEGKEEDALRWHHLAQHVLVPSKFLRASVPAETLRALFPTSGDSPFECAALSDHYGILSFTREGLAPVYPEQYSYLDGLLATPPARCRFELAKRADRYARLHPTVKLTSAPGAQYFAEYVGLKLLAVGLPDISAADVDDFPPP